MAEPVNQAALSQLGHIRSAARSTGADFDYLVQTAERESAFDTRAQARTSSAAGLFQFIEQTWLSMMARHGEAHGYKDYADSITQNSNGRYVVTDPAKREQILDLRFDPEAASLMAGELAAENASVLRQRLGREPDAGELYIAHFLGAGSAASLISTAEDNPGLQAAELFPVAARANRSIFYQGGQARNARDVVASLTAHVSDDKAPVNLSNVVENSVEYVAPQSESIAPRTWSIAQSGALPSGAVLSPAVVELLASLEAPQRGRDRS